MAVAVADGKLERVLDLPAVPVFDGMASAGGRLYLSLKDGTVICLGSGKPAPYPDDVLKREE